VNAVVDKIPLVRDAKGVYRVGGTRVSLDLAVRAFNRGATAEEIAQKYDSLQLPDVYQVLGYYLKHADELAGYFENRARGGSLAFVSSGVVAERSPVIACSHAGTPSEMASEASRCVSCHMPRNIEALARRQHGRIAAGPVTRSSLTSETAAARIQTGRASNSATRER
jgi:uncharacterized protein (DUF433 family)